MAADLVAFHPREPRVLATHRRLPRQVPTTALYAGLGLALLFAVSLIWTLSRPFEWREPMSSPLSAWAGSISDQLNDDLVELRGEILRSELELWQLMPILNSADLIKLEERLEDMRQLERELERLRGRLRDLKPFEFMRLEMLLRDLRRLLWMFHVGRGGDAVHARAERFILELRLLRPTVNGTDTP